MKKQLNPILYRNYIFSTYLNYSYILKNKNVKSLILFQDEEIKNNISTYLDNFNIKILDFQIIRNFNILNINLTFYNKETYISVKEKIINNLLKLNFIKFDLLKYMILNSKNFLKKKLYKQNKKFIKYKVIKKNKNNVYKKK